MPRYTTKHTRTASSSLSVGSIGNGGTTQRIKIYDLFFGCEGAAADNPYVWELQRYTAAGTSTAVTPQKLDPQDAAARSIAGENHTVDPTVTAGDIPFSQSVYQKTSWRWVAREGGEILVPAAANNGMAIRTPTASALAVRAMVHFEE